MLKKIKSEIRTFFDDIRALLTGTIVIAYDQAEMDRVKKAHGLEHMTDQAAASLIFADMLQDRRAEPRNKNSYGKERSEI